MNHFLKGFGTYVDRSAWSLQVLVVIIATVATFFFAVSLLKRLRKREELGHWHKIIVASIFTPLRLIILITGIGMASSIIANETGLTIFQSFVSLRDVLVVIVAGWFALNFIKNTAEFYRTNTPEHEKIAKDLKIDRNAIDGFSHLAQAAVIIICVLISLPSLGFSISGILAFGGVGGVAIGYAAKDVLSNFIGGVVIYSDRPFTVGENIKILEKNIEGAIESIGWRKTIIRTPDRKLLIIPNSMFSSMLVENGSRLTSRRIHEVIYVDAPNAAVLGRIASETEKFLAGHDKINQNPSAHISSFGRIATNMEVTAFTNIIDHHQYCRLKEEVLLNIATIITENGGKIVHGQAV